MFGYKTLKNNIEKLEKLVAAQQQKLEELQKVIEAQNKTIDVYDKHYAQQSLLVGNTKPFKIETPEPEEWKK